MKVSDEATLKSFCIFTTLNQTTDFYRIQCYNYKVLVGNSDPKVNEFEVVGNIHQNPELLEEK